MQAARIIARGACVNRPATLVARDETHLDVAAIRACRDGVDSNPAPAEIVRGDTPSTISGEFDRGVPCKTTAPDRVCVEGGAFVMGSDRYAGIGIASPTPRVARVSTFYVDRDEIGVGWLRAHMKENGLNVRNGFLVRNPGPISLSPLQLPGACTFSDSPGTRDDYPVNCITQTQAREFCTGRGGDLPTEAMWEFMARKAGRETITRFVDGNEAPACEGAVIDRFGPHPSIDAQGTCSGLAGGPGPQRLGTAPLDVTPLGILGLTGSMSEWVRDSFEPQDHDCWRDAKVDDPFCQVAWAPLRSMRGGSWLYTIRNAEPVLRGARGSATREGDVGFRCVFTQP